MKRAFLYIDILGFENLAVTNSPKIKNIFEILDRLGSHNHQHYFSLQTVVFSDTVLIFNKSDTEANDVHLYVTYLGGCRTYQPLSLIYCKMTLSSTLSLARFHESFYPI